jgi:hypothetical protein
MAVPFKRGSMHNTCKPVTSVSIDLSIWGMQSCSGFVHLTPIRTTEESNTSPTHRMIAESTRTEVGRFCSHCILSSLFSIQREEYLYMHA